MRASLAAFTSEAVAPAGTRWVELLGITCQDTPCGREATINTTIATSLNSLASSVSRLLRN